MKLPYIIAKFDLHRKTIGLWIAVVALFALTWYQSFFMQTNVVAALRSNIVSMFQSDENIVLTEVGLSSELSTGSTEVLSFFSNEVSWEIRKSQQGESIWAVYESMVAQTDITFKNQAVNGLKNLTILQNKIAPEILATNSLVEGNDYSFLSRDAQDKYLHALTSANIKLQSGVALQDLETDLQTAYKIANPPSYDFLFSLDIGSLSASVGSTI